MAQKKVDDDADDDDDDKLIRSAISRRAWCLAI